MKPETKYICEICGAKFESPIEANACELRHKVEKNLEELKAKRSKIISDLFNRYIIDFEEVPDIELEDDAAEVFASLVSEGLIKIIVDALAEECEDDEDDEEEEKQEDCCCCHPHNENNKGEKTK